jgi:hypothetical protein
LRYYCGIADIGSRKTDAHSPFRLTAAGGDPCRSRQCPPNGRALGNGHPQVVRAGLGPLARSKPGSIWCWPGPGRAEPARHPSGGQVADKAVRSRSVERPVRAVAWHAHLQKCPVGLNLWPAVGGPLRRRADQGSETWFARRYAHRHPEARAMMERANAVAILQRTRGPEAAIRARHAELRWLRDSAP